MREARLHLIACLLCVGVNGGIFINNYLTYHKEWRWGLLLLSLSAVAFGLWGMWVNRKTVRILRLEN